MAFQRCPWLSMTLTLFTGFLTALGDSDHGRWVTERFGWVSVDCLFGLLFSFLGFSVLLIKTPLISIFQNKAWKECRCSKSALAVSFHSRRRPPFIFQKCLLLLTDTIGSTGIMHIFSTFLFFFHAWEVKMHFIAFKNVPSHFFWQKKTCS